MNERPNDAFELVGDSESLPDEFFDALAGLLLAREQDVESQLTQRKEPRKHGVEHIEFKQWLA